MNDFRLGKHRGKLTSIHKVGKPMQYFVQRLGDKSQLHDILCGSIYFTLCTDILGGFLDGGSFVVKDTDRNRTADENDQNLVKTGVQTVTVNTNFTTSDISEMNC